jgi:ParB/RepB/Spo0J family partition protein
MNLELLNVAPSTLIQSPQVRSNVGQDPAFASLIDSVRTLGVMQPILARRVGKTLHVIAGHRRTLAAIAAELPTVPVFITHTPDDEVTARQLVENIHRQDLNLHDTAQGVRALYDEHRSARLVGEMLGKSAPWVSKMLALTAEATGTQTQRLIAADELPDLECAYLLATIERRVDLKGIQEVIESLKEASAPREYLRSFIKRLDAEKPPEAPAPTVSATKGSTDSVTLYLTRPEAALLKQYLDGPAPGADPHGIAIHLRAIINGVLS